MNSARNLIIEQIASRFENSAGGVLIFDKSGKIKWSNDIAKKSGAFSGADAQVFTYALSGDDKSEMNKLMKVGFVNSVICGAKEKLFGIQAFPSVIFGVESEFFVGILTPFSPDSPDFFNHLFLAFSEMLRSPLATVFANVNLLKQKSIMTNDTAGEQYSQTVYDNCFSMYRSVEAISLFYKYFVEKIKPDTTAYNIGSYMRSFCADAENVLAGKAKLTLSISDESAKFRINKQHFDFVMSNIVSNSCIFNYSPIAEIDISVSENPDETLEIAVSDNGTGFKNDVLENAFRPFFSVGPQGQSPYRPGLGLPVSQRIVNALGGNISLDNGFEGGAVTTIMMPKFQDRFDDFMHSPDYSVYPNNPFSVVNVQLGDAVRK